MTRLSYPLLVLTAALLLIAGCGSSNNTANNQPPGTQPPPGSPPPGTPPPAAQTPQYEAALLRPGKTADVAGGQIIVNANGASGVGKVTATNGAVSATYTITFEPFTNSTNAIKVGTVTSDASGNINGSFTFSQKGTFAGVFHLSAGTNSFNTEIDPMDSGVDDNTNFVFSVPLVQASKVSPTINEGNTLGSDPLTAGAVVAGGGHVHIELHGAAPNATYTAGACGVNDSSSCNSLSGVSITTDASGNGSFDAATFLDSNGGPALIVEIFHNNQLQYVSGFTVQ